jgi:hypothetical protein
VITDYDAELFVIAALVRGNKRRAGFNVAREGWKHGHIRLIVAEQKREHAQNTAPEIRLLDYRNLRWILKSIRRSRRDLPLRS